MSILPEERKSLMVDPNEQGVVVVRGGAEVFAQEIAAERRRFGR